MAAEYFLGSSIVSSVKLNFSWAPIVSFDIRNAEIAFYKPTLL
jgi:hypothetical protein